MGEGSGGKKPGSEGGPARPALRPWASSAALSGGAESSREAWPRGRARPWPCRENGGERPTGGWAAGAGDAEALDAPRRGRALQVQGTAGVRAEKSESRASALASLRIRVCRRPLLPACFSPSLFSRWERLSEVGAGMCCGEVQSQSPLLFSARRVPLPQVPHLTPEGRSSHRLAKLSGASGPERVKSHLPCNHPSLRRTPFLSPPNTGWLLPAGP